MTATLTAPAEPQVQITRVFNAPRELVFAAWTEPARLANWYAPRGCSIEIKELDVAQGGALHTCIRSPEGHACWVRGVYNEVAPPERLVYTMWFSDEHGARYTSVEAGRDADWPDETITTVVFTEEPGGGTRVILHQTVAESIAKRTGAHPSWLQMLDRLEEDLASA